MLLTLSTNCDSCFPDFTREEMEDKLFTFIWQVREREMWALNWEV
jgi:hypothetical protein